MDSYFSLLLRMVSMLSSENYGRKSISLDMVPYRCRLFKEARLRLLSHAAGPSHVGHQLALCGDRHRLQAISSSLHNENVIVY